ncbi:hypothetical protein [Aquimarina rhabdastrellae]
MKKLIDEIKEIDLTRDKETLFLALDEILKLILKEIKEDHKLLIKNDFESFKIKGRYLIQNTFAGGVIFLKEPEIIEKARINVKTNINEALIDVIYDSKNRNSINMKYKPDVTKDENTEWNMQGIFSNFDIYHNEIKVVLMMVIGKYIKAICEDLNQSSWFMRYTKDFKLEILFDDIVIFKLDILVK